VIESDDEPALNLETGALDGPYAGKQIAASVWVGCAASKAEADRLVAELSAGRRSPSTFFYWITRGGGR
jgi:hypothetical protein